MPTLPPKLIDCPKCGNVNRVIGWDGRADWRCQNCGLTLLRAVAPEQEPGAAPALKNSPRSEAPSRSSAPLPNFKQWTNIKRLPTPEELESMDPHPQPPEWLVRPELPKPPAPRDGFPDSVQRSASFREDGLSSRPEELPAEPEGPDDEPPAWDLAEIEELQPRKKPEPGADATRRPSRPAWFPRMLAFSGVALLLVLVGWLVHSVLTSRDRQTPAAIFESKAEDPADWRKLAPAVAEKFANSSSPEEWLPMVRDPDRVARMIRAFKPKFASGRALSIRPFGSEPFGDDELYQFTVTYEDGRSRLIHVVPTPEGPKVDWEAFARSGGAGFSELTAPVKVETELRVLARRARYYNYNFADDRRWRAYEIINGDWPEPLTGYVAIGSIADDFLGRMVRPGLDDPPVRLILKVRGGGDDGARGQLEILEVVQQGWVKS
jgi:hypothetical protein